MSKTVDRERQAIAAEERWHRIEEACRRISTIARMRRDGRSLDDIATALGIGRSTVQRLVVAAKVIERKCQRSPTP